MNEYYNIFFLYIAGCAGGFLSGLLGVGGGIIFVPIFDYFLKKNGVSANDLVSYTLANSFFSVMISGFTGSFSAFRNKNFDLKHFFSVSVAAIVFILITTFLINKGQWYSPVKFKIFFCVMLIFTLIKTWFHNSKNNNTEKMNIKIGLITGSVTGIVSGLSGLGGGVIMIPMFTILGNMNIKKASLLSLAVIPVLALPSVIYYAIENPFISLNYSTGYIAWLLVLPVVVGVITTVKIGLNTAKLLSADTIKTIFAAFIIVTLIKIITSI